VNEQRIWVVCPSYTDVTSFLMVRENVLEALRDLALGDVALGDWSARFVVVDDTAGDDPEMEDLSPFDDVSVVTPPFNLGHQRAIVYGLRTISRQIDDDDLVVTMDADGEDRPEDLPRLLAPLTATSAHRKTLCLARRTKRSESFRFRFMYVFFRIMFRTMTGATIRTGNYAAYRGWLAKRMLRHPYFDLCYSSSLVSLDLAVTPVPCPRGTRYAGRSRMNAFRLFMHGLRMLMPFTDRIAVRALVTFSGLFAASILGFLAVIAVKVFTSAAIPGWATTTLIGIVILSFLALGNFMVLFVVFSHSRGISLDGLEEAA